ncbi:MAG: hypothetical protein KBS63_04975 [Clostridiales bacterium]|nr:hypothetical protein [Candidatus Crickella caballi]
MRIRLLLHDREYCRAFAAMIAAADKDIFVELAENYSLAGIEETTLIVTDLSPEKIKREYIERSSGRIVFLTEDPRDKYRKDESLHKLFKYSSISSMLSDLSHINYLWTGENSSAPGIARIFAVCSDRGDLSPSLCRTLARQILFRHGGRILVIPVGYINEYAIPDETDKSKFTRLMYYIDTEKEYTPDAFTYCDNYGISYLRLPPGLNPIAYIDSDELAKLVCNLAGEKFNTIIIDISSAYSRRNLDVISKADNILFTSFDEKKLDIGEITDDPEILSRFDVIRLSGNGKVELSIDEYVKKIYGIVDEAENEDEQKENGNKVQKGNRRIVFDSKKVAD